MIVLTFDMDWAPEFVLEPVLESLQRRGLKATVFATSPMSLSGNGMVEYALHPNFMQDSTQGRNVDEILDNLTSWFPQARGVRTHRLYWYSGLIGAFKKRGLVYDNSLFLPMHPHLEPVLMEGYLRFPFWWADILHLLNGYPLDKVEIPNLDRPGLKIFDFHPIHLYLNTKDVAQTRTAMAELPPIGQVTQEDLEPLRNPGPGIGSFFETLLDYVVSSQGQSPFMRELMT